MIENADQSPKARGQRLRYTRHLADLTLKEMTENSDINFHTLAGWESGKHGGLTSRGAAIVIDRFAKANVKCSVEWLLHGTGEQPVWNDTSKEIQKCSISSFKDFLPQQIQYFEKAYPDFIGLVIQDDSMTPIYHYGDYVTGMPMSFEQLYYANGKSIIVKLDSGRLLCRMLVIDSIHRSFSLVASNLKHHEPMILSPKIVEWAMVLCHLRNESL